LFNNFIVFSENPLKICVLIISLSKILKSMYSNIKIENVIEKYLEIANSIIDETDTIYEVDKMVKDKCYNGYEVLDMI
jgi:hypothetical protein